MVLLDKLSVRMNAPAGGLIIGPQDVIQKSGTAGVNVHAGMKNYTSITYALGKYNSYTV